MNSASSVRPPETPAAGPAPAGSGNRTILQIEDHAPTRALVERLVRKFRPQIGLHVATNARDGVQAAIDEQPALILLDNWLPDGTGDDVLRQLSAAEATAGIPVIIISGESAQIGRELLAGGAAEFLPKPFDIHEFLTMVDRYIP
jgi:DNA-binding response OmpR family regulator